MNTKEVIQRHIEGYLREIEVYQVPTESTLYAAYAAKIAALVDLREDLDKLNLLK